MTLRFEQILADGVAECSYLLGDDEAHADIMLFISKVRIFDLETKIDSWNLMISRTKFFSRRLPAGTF